MQYIIFAVDGPDGVALRKKHRPEHAEYLKSQDNMLMAGPLLDEDGETPKGSVIVIEAANIEEARTFQQNDPYTAAGVFADVTVSAWKKSFGSLPDE